MGMLVGALLAAIVIYSLYRTAVWIGGGLAALHRRETDRYRAELEEAAGPTSPLERRDAWAPPRVIADRGWPDPIRHPVTGQIINFPNKGD